MVSSLGLIEVGAIEAGDTAVKAANVTLIGMELTKGGGLVTVKIEGEVSAVKAAVEAGAIAAEKLTTVKSKLVIARPSNDVAKMFEPVDELDEKIEDVIVEAVEEVVEEINEEIRVNEKLENDIEQEEIIVAVGKKKQKK